MSLDINLMVTKRCPHCARLIGERYRAWEDNITHNLNKMAGVAGLYYPIWHPEKMSVARAGELVPLLRAGLSVLKDDPDEFKKHNPSNGWGTYDDFVPWVERYLEACEQYPDAKIEAHG